MVSCVVVFDVVSGIVVFVNVEWSVPLVKLDVFVVLLEVAFVIGEELLV